VVGLRSKPFGSSRGVLSDTWGQRTVKCYVSLQLHPVKIGIKHAIFSKKY
jgi:hypothetical protein